MRSLIFCVALGLSSLGAVPDALAQDASDQAIRGVIQGQMDAFTAKDPGLAFTYASPMIKGMFGTPDNFGAMVQSGYPMIWSPAAVRYLGLREAGGRLIQRIMVTDATGATHLFDYDMVEVAGEGWRINGVYPVPDQGAGA